MIFELYNNIISLMRIKLFIEQQKPEQIIPINYQYAISSFIYKTIAYGNSDYSKWLHDVGFIKNNKQFKFFNFSPLYIPKYEIHSDRIKILSNKIELIFSTITIQSVETFVIGLFQKQKFFIKDNTSDAFFAVKYAEQIPEPVFSEYNKFRCLSPMVVSIKTEHNGKPSEKYLSPEDDKFKETLIKNIEEKYLAYCLNFGYRVSAKSIESIDINSKAKSQLITVKQDRPDQTRVKGFKFDFTIKGNNDMIKLCYETGFGKLCSVGFGFVNKIN